MLTKIYVLYGIGHNVLINKKWSNLAKQDMFLLHHNDAQNVNKQHEM